MIDTCSSCGKEFESGIFAKFGSFCWDCYDAYKKKHEEQIEKEKVELKGLNQCIFLIAWIGWCKKEGHPWCEEHNDLTCSNKGCDNQAVESCDHSFSLVCGAPYCNECGEHNHTMSISAS
mgnify:CR=1 FL=1